MVEGWNLRNKYIRQPKLIYFSSKVIKIWIFKLHFKIKSCTLVARWGIHAVYQVIAQGWNLRKNIFANQN